MIRAHLLLLVLAWSTGPADDPPPGSVSAIKATHDRRLVADLVAYLQAHPQSEDRDQAYLAIFEAAIEHDWFVDTETTAQRYLDERPDGPVRSLALIVTTMARAQDGKFAEAATRFQQLLDGLDRDDQIEFASEFADNLAGVATTAGAYDVARKVYDQLLARYKDQPALRDKVKDDLARLDRVGKPAPVVIANDIDGKMIRLSDLKGRYVLVDFWATWCVPCLAELPNLQKAYQTYHDKGFEVIGVSLDEKAETVADFVKARKLPWRQVHNATAGADLVEAFGVNNIPATFLIGPDGTILRLELRGPALDKALAGLIK